MGPLTDIRVLDLTSPIGVYCTKLLAELGADVIRIEPPGGDPTRNVGPFYHDEIAPEKSLYFWHFNCNKRSITLNLQTDQGREILRKLAQRADVVVETFPPGYLDNLGIGYDSLTKINPKLILTSVMPFGQDGPYSHYKGYDIVGAAMGGLMWLGGFPEDPPNYPGGYQAYNLASTDAAIATLLALYHRDMTGWGQHIDVSMQEAVISATEFSIVAYTVRKIIRKRTGRQVFRGWNEVYPCKDGYVVCSPFGGGAWRKMLEWVDSEGKAADLMEERYQDLLDIMGDVQMDRRPSGARRDPRALAGRDEEIAHVEQVWEQFLKTHTPEELYQRCQAMQVRLAPIYDATDQLGDPQLLARSWFTTLEHPELGVSLTHPGAPYRFSETPWQIDRRAPLVGEHNVQIYRDELGISLEEMAILKQEGII